VLLGGRETDFVTWAANHGIDAEMPYLCRLGGEGAVQDRNAKFSLGDVVCHRLYPFRGVIFDVDPEFANSEEWWLSIPEAVRPIKEQPYYHLLAENEEATYEAYVSEQNLLTDESGVPCRHPLVDEYFESCDGQYVPRSHTAN
jgi:heat shock protein HspQ